MALAIEGYTYIAHKLIQRPWGAECRFTFADGNELDRYLLAKAKEIREEDIKASIERMQHRITSLTAPKFEGNRFKKAWAALTGKL